MVDKHFCFRGGGDYDQHANRKAQNGRGVEGEVQENGGARVQCIFL